MATTKKYSIEQIFNGDLKEDIENDGIQYWQKHFFSLSIHGCWENKMMIECGDGLELSDPSGCFKQVKLSDLIKEFIKMGEDDDPETAIRFCTNIKNDMLNQIEKLNKVINKSKKQLENKQNGNN